MDINELENKRKVVFLIFFYNFLPDMTDPHCVGYGFK